MNGEKPKRYVGEFKQEVVETMRAEKLSYCETAARFDTSDKSVCEWERIYLEEGREALFRTNCGRKNTSDKIKPKKPKLSKKAEQDLIAENEYLRAENDYLKNLHALVSKQGQDDKKHKYHH